MDASLFEGTAITTPRPQRLGREYPAPYTVLALDADQSRPETTNYVVKRKRGHR
jgi:hypothetical protein